MVIVLVGAVIFCVIMSFACSISEAAIYSVPLTYVRHLEQEGTKVGKILVDFKEDIGKPISLILVLNTLSNSLGPLVAGWAIAEISGNNLWVVSSFSLCFAALILVVGEIVPKTAGAVYAKGISKAVALPIFWLIRLFGPLIALSKKIQSILERHRKEEPSMSHHEVLTMAEMGTEEGVLDDFEGEVIQNVIGLDEILVKDILTPRVVVFRLVESSSLEELAEDIANWQFSRIPLYSEDDPDHLNSYVTQRDIYRELLKGNKGIKLSELSRKLETVPELMQADKLLKRMFDQREHICAVVDEHGGLAGIVTLEDILEELVGREIVDEYDAVSDLRTFAKILRVTKKRAKAG